MAKGVPSSFKDLKTRAARRLSHGSHDVKSDIIEMGDDMLQSGVKPKTAEDKLAKRAWQAAGPEDKERLAGMVSNMAQDEPEL